MAQTQLPAVQIKDNDIKNVDIAADAAIAFSKLAGVAASSHVHSAADITTGTFADVRIAVGNVTQHVASIVHDSLSGFVAAEHVDWAAADSGTIHVTNYIKGGAGTDTTAIHDNVGAEIFAIANKTVPDPLDVFITEDEGDGYAKTRVTFAQVEAALNHDSLSGFLVTEHYAWGASNIIDIHDANISQSSVTQHVAAIDHDALSNFVSDEHINWTNSQAGMRFVHNDNINGIDKTIAILDGNGMQTHNFTFTNGVLTVYSLV